MPTASSSSFAWPSQAHRAGRLDEAITSYLRLLAVRPYHAELHNNLGVALRLAGKLEASVSHHRLSLAADPQNPALHSNLGNALRAANRLDEAVKHHFQSIALNRDYGEGFFNLALCLRDLGRLDEAVGCFSRALTLNPDNRRARVELAIALLMRGELAPGFAAYEARKRLPETPAPEFPQPAWDGGPLGGKRILLYPEQGLGDVLLFVRFARELKRRGATVIVLCQALLKELAGHRRLRRRGRGRGRGAARVRPACLDGVAAASLPRRLRRAGLPGACLSSRAGRQPHQARPHRAGQAQRRHLLGGACPARRRIASARCRSRSSWRFAGDPELLVFSLQGGVHQKDIQTFGAGGLVHDVGRGIFDFAEAATALSQLDLLISIDAPVAHLAAAMGIKTWVLLAVDGRLALAARRQKRALVSSARLFRQSVSGDWSPVFAAVRSELHPEAPMAGSELAIGLGVVDIVQHVRKSGRHVTWQASQRVGQRRRRRPAHPGEQRPRERSASSWHRLARSHHRLPDRRRGRAVPAARRRERRDGGANRRNVAADQHDRSRRQRQERQLHASAEIALSLRPSSRCRHEIAPDDVIERVIRRDEQPDRPATIPRQSRDLPSQQRPDRSALLPELLSLRRVGA